MAEAVRDDLTDIKMTETGIENIDDRIAVERRKIDAAVTAISELRLLRCELQVDRNAEDGYGVGLTPAAGRERTTFI